MKNQVIGWLGNGLIVWIHPTPEGLLACTYMSSDVAAKLSNNSTINGITRESLRKCVEHINSCGLSQRTNICDSTIIFPSGNEGSERFINSLEKIDLSKNLGKIV